MDRKRERKKRSGKRKIESGGKRKRERRGKREREVDRVRRERRERKEQRERRRKRKREQDRHTERYRCEEIDSEEIGTGKTKRKTGVKRLMRDIDREEYNRNGEVFKTMFSSIKAHQSHAETKRWSCAHVLPWWLQGACDGIHTDGRGPTQCSCVVLRANDRLLCSRHGHTCKHQKRQPRWRGPRRQGTAAPKS